MVTTRAVAGLLAQLWPGTCALCAGAADESVDLCAPCLASLPWLATTCPVCALPAATVQPCRRCRTAAPPFERTIAALDYAHPVDHLVHRLKYHRQLSAARTLGQLLATRLHSIGACAPQAILPVPLHPRRARARGFNQAIEIGRVVSRSLGVALRPALARRTRDTPSQASLVGVGQRRRNLQGAFEASLQPYEHLAILDDVVTSAATVTALTRCLRAAGVGRIDVWTVARAT